MARCSGCMLSYPCWATQDQSLTACHPVQPSWHLPPGVLAAYASKQGGFSWQAWAPAQLHEPHPASPSRSSPAGGGRGRGTVAEKDTMGLQGPTGSGALLGDQLSPNRQNLASQAGEELATAQEQIPHPISQMLTYWRSFPRTPIGILLAQKSAYCVGAEATNAGEQVGDVTGGLNPKNTGKKELDLLGDSAVFSPATSGTWSPMASCPPGSRGIPYPL